MRFATRLAFACAMAACAVPATAAAQQPVLSLQEFSGRIPVGGLADARGSMTVSLLLQQGWRPFRRSNASLRGRNVEGTCTHALTFRLRLVASRSRNAARHVTSRLPNQPSRGLLDEGTRRSGAWRVVRRPGDRVAAVYAIPSHATWEGLGDSERVYQEVFVTGAPQGESCAAGRQRKVGRAIGDSLATVETRTLSLPTRGRG